MRIWCGDWPRPPSRSILLLSQRMHCGKRGSAAPAAGLVKRHYGRDQAGQIRDPVIIGWVGGHERQWRRSSLRGLIHLLPYADGGIRIESCPCGQFQPYLVGLDFVLATVGQRQKQLRCSICHPNQARCRRRRNKAICITVFFTAACDAFSRPCSRSAWAISCPPMMAISSSVSASVLDSPVK